MMILLLIACASSDRAKPATDTSESGTSDTGDTNAPGPLVADIEVTVHPEIGSILVVRWAQDVPADMWIEYGLAGEPAMVTPTAHRTSGAQEQLLLGIPYDSDVELRLIGDTGAGPTASEPLTARTGVIPETVPVPVLDTADAAAWSAEDRWLLIGMSSGGEGWEATGFWKLILDRKGRVVWAHETPGGYRSFYVQPSVDGTHILWDEDTFWTDFDEGAGSLVHRMTLDGAVLETVEAPGLHHAFVDLGGGGLAWGGVDEGREVLRERDSSGDVREIWDCTAWWRGHGATLKCDGNALYWNPDDDTFLYSSDNENTVAEVDRASGEVLRSVGQLDGSLPFAAGTEPFWKQHGVHWTSAGTLLLSSWTNERDHQVIAREYAVDGTEVREIWRCGEGTGTTGEYAGEAHRLLNGNTLINYGEGGQLREYTPDCAEVWHLTWPYANLLGRAVFLSELYAFVPAPAGIDGDG